MLPECRTIGSQNNVFLGGCPKHSPAEVREGDGGPGKERSDSCESWRRLVQCGPRQEQVERCMESEPGRAPTRATSKWAYRREDCAVL